MKRTISRSAIGLCSVLVILASAGCDTVRTSSKGSASGSTLSAPPRELVASVNGLAAEVSPARLRRDIDTLAGFGTRHTLSDTASDTRGIGAARRWIFGEFEAIAAQRASAGLPAMRVELDPHVLEAGQRRIDQRVEIANVVAVIPGRLESSGVAERIYLSGHYDSRNSGEMDRAGDAPGANDDASGTAAVIEACRVMARREWDHTLVFVAFDAEEAGLYGARQHVGDLVERGVAVRGVLNNDIMGDPTSPRGVRTDGEIHLFSEGLPATPPGGMEAMGGRNTATGGPSGMLVERLRREGALNDSSSRQLARFVADVAREHRTAVQPTLVFRADRFLRGGDHTPFHEAGFAGVRFTEVDEDYNRQHQNVRVENGVQFGDLPEFVDEQYLANVTRLNVSAAARLANAPGTPANPRIITAELSNDTLLRWNAPADPDVAGYEVVWRSTSSPEWESSRDVGPANEIRMPQSKDRYFFGVRAYDRDGNRGLVGFAYAARE